MDGTFSTTEPEQKITVRPLNLADMLPAASTIPMHRPPLTPNSLRVLEARYLRKDPNGSIVETPTELFRRVAQAVAQAEKRYGNHDQVARWEEEFYELLSSLNFLPNSPALMNAGTPGGQLSACFVIPIEDSIDSIFDALKLTALVQKTGGGTGFSFSKLRPRGDLVQSSGGTASGPVSFMKIFDSATEHIKQGGKRRGANMGVLRVDHPDILEFVAAKLDGQCFQNFNISVGITDAFFQAVNTNQDYDLIHPGTQRPVGRLAAQTVFDAIVRSAWQTGDPGLLFLDAINRTNPNPKMAPIEATNPCGEIPLLPNEACNLGSINLAHFVDMDAEVPTMLWTRLKATVHCAIRFLDNLIDVNNYPTAEIGAISRGNRKIGLGVMGLADCLIRLGIPYNSRQALSIGERIMTEIQTEAHAASEDLARTRGAFPNWETSVFKQRKTLRRNATCTAIAPTGTISIIAGTTPGIEPIFSLISKRSHALGGEPLYEPAPLLQQYWPDMPVLAHLTGKSAACDRLRVPERVTQLFVTALEMSCEDHLQIQAAFQRHVDNSVSKTINLPEQATREDIARAYKRAWELGLKGITVFRYGSKDVQVVEPLLGPEGQSREPTVCHPC